MPPTWHQTEDRQSKEQPEHINVIRLLDRNCCIAPDEQAGKLHSSASTFNVFLALMQETWTIYTCEASTEMLHSQSKCILITQMAVCLDRARISGSSKSFHRDYLNRGSMFDSDPTMWFCVSSANDLTQQQQRKNTFSESILEHLITPTRSAAHLVRRDQAHACECGRGYSSVVSFCALVHLATIHSDLQTCSHKGSRQWRSKTSPKVSPSKMKINCMEFIIHVNVGKYIKTCI